MVRAFGLCGAPFISAMTFIDHPIVLIVLNKGYQNVNL